MDNTRIFVYGTLRGDCSGPNIVGKYIGADVISGNLYDLGWYPGVRDVPPDYVSSFWEPTGNVVGEVWEVTPEVLEQLDSYEGADATDPYNPNEGLYHRVKTKTFAGREVEVYVYTDEITKGLIPHGDWQRHSQEKAA